MILNLKLTKVFLTTCLFLSLNLAFGQVVFSESSFEDVVQTAKKEDKLVMIDAYTQWCGWCKVMDKKTFSQPEIGEFVNARFVSTKIDMEDGFGIDLAMKYRVSFYPQYLFFDGDGHLIGRLGGFMEPGPFLEALDGVMNTENYLPPLPEPMNFDMGFPDFYRNSFKKRNERSYPTPEELLAWLETRESITDQVTWGVVSRFVSNGNYADKIVENKDILMEKYGEKEVIEKLSKFVFADVKVAIKDSSYSELEHAMEKADLLLGDEAEGYKFRYKSYYYQMTEDWVAYANLGQELAGDKENFESSTLNQMGWAIYEKSSSETAINLAANWMNYVVKKEPTYAYLDTYAALLFKSGQKEKALNTAEQAIKAAEEEGADSTGTQELISKIKSL